MRMNSRTNEPIKLQGENIEEVEEFTYLGSKITADGSSEREIHARLSEAGQAFATQFVRKRKYAFQEQYS